jgi:hypothetical protein
MRKLASIQTVKYVKPIPDADDIKEQRYITQVEYEERERQKLNKENKNDNNF